MDENVPRSSPTGDVESGSNAYHDDHQHKKKKKKKKRDMKKQHPTLFAKYWDLYVVGGFPYYLIAFCLSVCGYALRGVILGNANHESCSVNLSGYLSQISLNAVVYGVFSLASLLASSHVAASNIRFCVFSRVDCCQGVLWS